MAAQHDGRDEELFTKSRRNIERHRMAIAAFRLPCLAGRDMLLEQTVEGLQQTPDRECRRRFGAAPKPECEHDPTRKLGHQSDIAGSRLGIFSCHRAVAGEILPAIAIADIPGAGSADRIALLFVYGHQGGPERPLLGPQDAAIAVHDSGSAVAVSGGAKMRRAQGIELECWITVETAFDRQHVAPRSRCDAQTQRIALMLVHDLDRRDTRRH